MRKSISGFDKYEVTDMGNVISLSRYVRTYGTRSFIIKEKTLKSKTNRGGYSEVTLMDSKSKKKSILVHKIVAVAYIPNPNKYPQVNHKNGIKTDNKAENLEWATAKENTRHAINNGLRPPQPRFDHGLSTNNNRAKYLKVWYKAKANGINWTLLSNDQKAELFKNY